MVLLLAEQLEVPVRERNQLLLAAGHAPAIPERSLADPELAPVREALDLILAGHDPYPAVVVDRGWNLVAANSAMTMMATWVDPALLQAPVNVMRVGLHPLGLARWTVNLGEVRAYFLGRLARQVAITGDEDLAALLQEVTGYPAPEHRPTGETATSHIITPLMRMRSPEGDVLSFFATVATFGTATEVTTSELSIELTFPADAATAEAMRNLRAKAPPMNASRTDLGQASRLPGSHLLGLGHFEAWRPRVIVAADLHRGAAGGILGRLVH